MTFHADNYYHVALNDLTLSAKIGIADWERHANKKQQIIVDVDLYQPMDTFTGTDIKDCMDYARVYAYITKNWPTRPHTDLLETLLEELVAFCFEDANIHACRVSIRKPHVFDGVGVPKVTFFRQR